MTVWQGSVLAAYNFYVTRPVDRDPLIAVVRPEPFRFTILELPVPAA